MADSKEKKQTDKLKSKLIKLHVKIYERDCSQHGTDEDICFGIERRGKIHTCSTRKCPSRDEYRKRLENMDIAEFVKAKKTTQI